ncbi:FAD-binding protein [Mycobacterium sp. LTG2003]
MMWDDEFDVVCCGTGFGALATAITAMDAGLEVFVARAGQQDATTPSRWLGERIEDPETRDYFDGLTQDLGPREAAAVEADVSIRAMSDLSPAELSGPVPPFYGARLRDWASRCLLSPYGVLYTRLLDRGTTPMRTPAGAEIDVKVIGAIQPDHGISASSAVNEWLLSQTRERGVQISDGISLERIVFEEGEIVGAVLTTADGPLALRARHGIAIAMPSRHGAGAAHALPEHRHSLQVALVGHSASRFGRVELLATDSPKPSRSGYCRINRLHDGLHEAGRSHARGSREVHGYPPLG